MKAAKQKRSQLKLRNLQPKKTHPPAKCWLRIAKGNKLAQVFSLLVASNDGPTHSKLETCNVAYVRQQRPLAPCVLSFQTTCDRNVRFDGCRFPFPDELACKRAGTTRASFTVGRR